MRIWSLHPKYLESKGLVALWRETLLNRFWWSNQPEVQFWPAKNWLGFSTDEDFSNNRTASIWIYPSVK